MKPRRFYLALAALLFAAAGNLSAQAAKRTFPRAEKGNPNKAQKINKQQERQQAEFERFQRMTPVQRQKALDRLPPERRARLEDRLKKLEQMQPAERQTLLRRFQAFQALPEERRREIRLELRHLRELSPPERKKRLQSPEMKQKFNDEERRMLEEVSAPGAIPTQF